MGLVTERDPERSKILRLTTITNCILAERKPHRRRFRHRNGSQRVSALSLELRTSSRVHISPRFNILLQQHIAQRVKEFSKRHPTHTPPGVSNLTATPLDGQHELPASIRTLRYCADISISSSIIHSFLHFSHFTKHLPPRRASVRSRNPYLTLGVHGAARWGHARPAAAAMARAIYKRARTERGKGDAGWKDRL